LKKIFKYQGPVPMATWINCNEVTFLYGIVQRLMMDEANGIPQMNYLVNTHTIIVNDLKCSAGHCFVSRTNRNRHVAD